MRRARGTGQRRGWPGCNSTDDQPPGIVINSRSKWKSLKNGNVRCYVGQKLRASRRDGPFSGDSGSLPSESLRQPFLIFRSLDVYIERSYRF